MELLDRYLQAVKFWLPKGQKQDIIAELSEDIRSQIEEKENELGRKLNEAEAEAIFKRVGRPVLVANRYSPQQYLIGPLLFPIYRFVLKIVALCYLVPWVLAWIGFMIYDPGFRAKHSGGTLIGALGSVWGPLWLAAFCACGVVTIVFAVLERAQTKSGFLEDWDPVLHLVDRIAIPDCSRTIRNKNHAGARMAVFFLGIPVTGTGEYRDVRRKPAPALLDAYPRRRAPGNRCHRIGAVLLVVQV